LRAGIGYIAEEEDNGALKSLVMILSFEFLSLDSRDELLLMMIPLRRTN
jgi:hypothetical protein